MNILRLTRKDQDRDRLRGLLLAGAESQASPVDPAYFEELRKRIRDKKKQSMQPVT